jgi:hypothetical protein
MFQDVELQLIKENPAMLYSDILAITYDQLARKLGAKDALGDPEPPTHSHAASSFAASVHVWPPFPDTVRALERLSLLGLNLVILANVDCASFAGTRTVLEQGFRFKEVFTAEEIGSYKYASYQTLNTRITEQSIAYLDQTFVIFAMPCRNWNISQTRKKSSLLHNLFPLTSYLLGSSVWILFGLIVQARIPVSMGQE